MKKFLCLLCISLACLSCQNGTAIPEGSIRFIYDGHLYLQATINDTIPLTVIYDTGADFLYLDEDYLQQHNYQDAFGKKGRAKIRGAGNGEPIPIDVFVEPINIRCGELNYQNQMTPIIPLRDILGRYTDGMLGNTHLINSPLQINFSEQYIKQLEHIQETDIAEVYQKLETRFEDNRIDVKARLQINSENVVEGWFRMDLGSGSAIMLTNETASTLNLSDLPKAHFTTQAGGIGGGSDDVVLRASKFTLTDEFENIVIECSLNEKGALSSNRPYVGIIGNEIWSLYDLFIDPTTKSLWGKRNANKGTYFKASTTHMAAFDRTDICEGWVVNGLYLGGIAEKTGFEIGDIILNINDRPVKEISWKEQREGLNLSGETKYTVQKKNGEIVTYILNIQDEII